MTTGDRMSGATVPGNGNGGLQATIGDLVRSLGEDLETLVRQEAALAKAEIGQVGRRLAKDGAAIGLAAALGLVGVLVVSAALVLILGEALDGRYWLSALIVGALFLVVAMIMGRRAIEDIKERGIAPRETVASLKEDKRWAAQQAKEFKHDLTKQPTR